MFRRFMCRWIACTQCALYSTPECIGGKCIHCGKIHGWVDRGTLRDYADREYTKHRINNDRGG